MNKKHTPVPKRSLLDNIEVYSDYLVSPIKSGGNNRMDSINLGIILKLPKKLATDCFPGEEWKLLLNPTNEFIVGDRVLYTIKYSIVLNGESLHLVPWFVGKIMNIDIK